MAVHSSGSSDSIGVSDAVGNRLNPAENGLVWLPFRKQDLAGTVTTPAGGTAFPENNDGTMTGLFYSAAASASWATTATTEFAFNGRAFGLRLSRNGYGDPIGLMIDRVAYPIPYGKFYVPETQVAFSASTPIETMIVTDLSDGEHFAQIIVPSSTVAARTAGILGYACEARCNPPPPPRLGRISREPQPVTTAYTAFGPSDVKVYAYSAMYLVNTTGADISVNIRSAGLTLDARQIKVPTGADVPWIFSRPITNNFQLKASAVGVNVSFEEMI
jgi:hypothetical protein